MQKPRKIKLSLSLLLSCIARLLLTWQRDARKQTKICPAVLKNLCCNPLSFYSFPRSTLFFILYFYFFIIILYQDGFDQHESGCLGAPWSYQALLRSRSSGPHQVKRKFHLVCQKYDDAFNRVLKRRDRCLKKFIGKLCINSCVVYL